MYPNAGHMERLKTIVCICLKTMYLRIVIKIMFFLKQ